MKPVSTVVALSTLLLLAGGCGTSRYGAQKRTVELRTAPGNYEVFLVPNQDWLRRRDALLADRGAGLARYSKGTAPSTVHLEPYEWVFVARDPAGAIRHTSFVPARNSTVSVDFGTAGTAGIAGPAGAAGNTAR